MLAWAVSNWLELIHLARQTYTAAPLWDYWRIVLSIPRYEHFDLTVLWEQHNEHRIIFPELAMAADALLLGCRAILPLTLAYGFQFLTLALYAWMLWSYLEPKFRWFTIFLGLAIAGWPGMALFLGHPFLVQWLFLQIGVVLGLAALPRSTAVAITGGLIANYSAANGLLIWPVLIVAAVALRLPKRQIVILAISGTLFSGLYFAGYHPGPNLHLALLFQHPVLAMKWAAAYLSLPFGFASADMGLAFGFGGMFLTAALIAVSVRRVQPASALFLGAALFVVGSAVLAATGRMYPDHVIPSTELDVRFVSVPLWFWLSLLFGVAFTIKDWSWNWLILPPAAILVASQFSATSPWISARLPEFEKDRLAALALESGVLDGPLLIDTLYYDPEFVERTEGNLRARKLSVFASGRFERIGKQSAAIFPKKGQLDFVVAENISATIVDGGMKLSGPSTDRVDDLVIVNEKGTAVGLGGRLGPGWTAFANLEIPSKTLQVIRVEGGVLSTPLIGQPVPVPQAIPIAFWRMGQFLSGIEWETTGGFTKGGVSPALIGQPYGFVYGDWRATGRGGGTLVSKPFDAPPGNCIVIPAGHASPVDGQIVELFDAEKQTRIATLPLSTIDNEWRRWRVDLPSSVRSLKISASDQGTGSTQWLGLGQPARCASSYQ